MQSRTRSREIGDKDNLLELFAQSLASEDHVVLEATGNALAIARIIEPHVARVVLAHPKAVKGLTQAGPKADKIDARALAKLLAGGFVREVDRRNAAARRCRRDSARLRDEPESRNAAFEVYPRRISVY